jgi:hypothetical protein
VEMVEDLSLLGVGISHRIAGMLMGWGAGGKVKGKTERHSLTGSLRPTHHALPFAQRGVHDVGTTLPSAQVPGHRVTGCLTSCTSTRTSRNGVSDIAHGHPYIA